MILAGDIGGTKCNLALFPQHEVPLRPALQRRYPTGNFGSLEQLIDQFFMECKAEAGLGPGANSPLPVSAWPELLWTAAW